MCLKAFYWIVLLSCMLECNVRYLVNGTTILSLYFISFFQALQSNLRYSLLPKRLIIGKRLAQCLHPALPSGVHLKALETYEVIFKIIGTKWLAKDLFIYRWGRRKKSERELVGHVCSFMIKFMCVLLAFSSGLFPLLGHAAMAVKPVLLTLYERYYLPLQRALLPSLQAFITGLLPGLEEGLEVYDRYMAHTVVRIGRNDLRLFFCSCFKKKKVRKSLKIFYVFYCEQ